MIVHINQVQEEMRSGQVPLEKYIITKTLTKPPEAYPDAKNQPHVLVSPSCFDCSVFSKQALFRFSFVCL